MLEHSFLFDVAHFENRLQKGRHLARRLVFCLHSSEVVLHGSHCLPESLDILEFGGGRHGINKNYRI